MKLLIFESTGYINRRISYTLCAKCSRWIPQFICIIVYTYLVCNYVSEAQSAVYIEHSQSSLNINRVFFVDYNVHLKGVSIFLSLPQICTGSVCLNIRTKFWYYLVSVLKIGCIVIFDNFYWLLAIMCKIKPNLRSEI
jgi:hypothetical protein